MRHGAFGWHVHATSDDAPLAERIAVEVGMALVDVIRAGETDRLKVCAGDDCEDLLIDLSKNRSRKFCDGTCGTRANVAAYRARKAATPADRPDPGRGPERPPSDQLVDPGTGRTVPRVTYWSIQGRAGPSPE